MNTRPESLSRESDMITRAWTGTNEKTEKQELEAATMIQASSKSRATDLDDNDFALLIFPQLQLELVFQLITGRQPFTIHHGWHTDDESSLPTTLCSLCYNGKFMD